MWQRLYCLIAIFILTMAINEAEHVHRKECGSSYLDQLVLNGKIDPHALSRSLETLDRIANGKGPDGIQAYLRLWDLSDWAAFRFSSDPRKWPDRLEEREPTMVYQHPETGEITVFWGGFANTVGSQFQSGGWFIESLRSDGMTIEHRGTGSKYNEATWEVQEITFKEPYIKAHNVGPGGFSSMLRLESPSWEEFEEDWKVRQAEDKARKTARDKRVKAEREAWRNGKKPQ